MAVGNSPGNGIAEGSFAMPNLSWEIEKKLNTGIDLGLFRGRVDFSADYFYNRRSDILLQRETVSNVSGLRVKPYQNFGIVRNQGVDANLILKQKVGNVDLSARGNLTYAKIRSLNETKSLRNTVIRHIQETLSTNHYCILRKDFILRMISILQQTNTAARLIN